MSRVAVQQVSPAEPILLPGVANTYEHIRQKAFGLFEQRGRAAGNDLDDWLTAEREMIFVLPSELMEEEFNIELRVAAPGFRADQLTVRASPGIIVVEGKAASTQERKRVRSAFPNSADEICCGNSQCPSRSIPTKSPPRFRKVLSQS